MYQQTAILKIFAPTYKTVQKKMMMWIDNGCQIGILIDYEKKTAYVYDADGGISNFDDFSQKLTFGDLMPGFELDLSRLV